MKTILSVIASITSIGFFAAYALWIVSNNTSYADHENYSDVTYTGDVRGGLFSGDGMLFFTNEEYYSGHFSGGRFDGEGTYSDLTNRWYFTGFFSAGQLNSGVYNTGFLEEVTYERGEKTNILSSDTWRYKGGFNDNGQYGWGTFEFSDGSIYTGNFLNGLAEGEGTLSSNTGRVMYKGGFTAGQFSGQGHYFSPEGWSYKGGFIEGLFSGEGVIDTGAEIIYGAWEKGMQVKRYAD
jgi:hypothetical protein